MIVARPAQLLQKQGSDCAASSACLLEVVALFGRQETRTGSSGPVSAPAQRERGRCFTEVCDE